MNLLSQIALFLSARQLIGLHGAALANIVRAQEGSMSARHFISLDAGLLFRSHRN